MFPGMDLNLLRAAAAAQAGHAAHAAHAAHASRVPFVPPPHFMAMAPDVPPLGDFAQPGETLLVSLILWLISLFLHPRDTSQVFLAFLSGPEQAIQRIFMP